MKARPSREEFAATLGVGADGDPKLNAAADFAARLLNGPAGEQVARIVLFGSVAAGMAGPNSDVDVMVFASLPRKQLSAAAAEAAWEATVEWGELVAQLTYTTGDMLQPRSYLIYDVLKRGREIYAMNTAEVRRQEAVALHQKAVRHLDQTQHALERGDYELAAVGAYTAAELAAKGLILLKPGVELASTHGGLIQIFSREYVKTGEVPAQWGRLLNEKLETRSRALYDTLLTMKEDDVRPAIDLALGMLAFLMRKLEEIQGGSKNHVRD